MQKNLLTTYEVSHILQVNPASVVKWIDQGILRSYRTPGGHRRIARQDLADFAAEQGMFVAGEEPNADTGSTNASYEVLLVDDDADTIRALRMAFDRTPEPFDVRSAADGIEALLQVGRSEPDLIMLDLFMPNVDGFEVCRRLKQEQHKEVKIIAITGQSDTSTKDEIMGCGADAYFEKPFDFGEVLDCARRLLRIPVPSRSGVSG